MESACAPPTVNSGYAYASGDYMT